MRPSQLLQDAVDLHSLRIGERGRRVHNIERIEQRCKPVVEVVQTFYEIYDPLVRAQRAGRQCLRARLIDLEQPPISKRALWRESFPFRILKNGKTQGKSRIGASRIVLGARA